MGQTIFTTWFLNIGKSFYSTLWLRLELEGFGFSKSNRKLMRKNDKLFRYEIKACNLDTEKVKLFDKYRVDFRGNIYSCLDQYLFDGQERNIFNTKEINVYHDDKLVAYSFFDLGKNSLTSIQGVYDPEYKQYSLGYYTMLLEIAYGLEHGYQYYYPGYVVPGYAHFDYKARIGDVDYFDVITENWLPYNNIEAGDIPLEILKSKMKALQVTFAEAGVDAHPIFYPYYEEPIISEWSERFLSHPLFLMYKKEGTPFYYVSTYHLKSKKYLAYLCFVSSDLTINATAQPARKFDDHFVPLRKILEIAMVFPPTGQLEKVLERAKLEIRVKGD